jgi:membrane protease YdiL (CAAX protease family)
MHDDLPPLLPEAPRPAPPADALTIAPAGPTEPIPLPAPGEEPRLRKPHPGFWFALLWCVGFVIFTQIPAAVAGGIVLAAEVMFFPSLAREVQQARNTEEVLATRAGVYSTEVALLVAEVLVIGVSWLVIRLVVGRNWPRQLALRRPGWAHVVLAVASLPALVLLADGSYALLKWLGVPNFGELLQWLGVKGPGGAKLPGVEEMARSFGEWPAPLAVLLVGLGPGIGEELWCRGFLGRGLVGRYGWWGVLATSFFFGFIHLDPQQGAMAMLMGLWLHFTYLASRSLLVPMLLHFLNNSLSVVSSRIEILNRMDQQAGDIPPYVYGTAVLLIVAVGWALWRSRARLEGEAGGPALWRPPYPGVEYPPPGTFTRVVHPRPPLTAALAAAAAFGVFVACCVLAFGAAG